MEAQARLRAAVADRSPPSDTARRAGCATATPARPPRCRACRPRSATSRTCVRCRQAPLTEYQSYCQVSRSNSQRSPLAATRLPSGSTRDDLDLRRAALPARLRRRSESATRSPAGAAGSAASRVSVTARPLGSTTLTRTVAASGFVRSGRSVSVSETVDLPSLSVAGASMSCRRAGELLAGQAELETGLARERRLVERDRRLGLDRQFRPGRAVVVARRRPSIGKASPGTIGPSPARQRHLQLRRHEILDAEFGRPDRRRLRVEAELDPPAADPRVARQR